MKRKILIFSAGLLSITALFLIITCALPSNPVEDPSNFKIEFYNKKTNVIQDSMDTISLIVNIPKQLQKITVSFGEDGIADQTIQNPNVTLATPETLTVSCAYKKAGQKILTAAATLANGLNLNFKDTFEISPKPFTIKFDSIPNSNVIAVNEIDSLKFAAHTEPVAAGIEFSVTSKPILDSSRLKIKPAGTAVMVYVNPSDTGKYTICLHAQSGAAIDTQLINLNAYNRPILSQKPKLDSIEMIGIPDTLVFTTKAEDSTHFELANKNDFTQGVVTVLSSQADTFKLLFIPDLEKTYKFVVVLSNKYLADTITINRTIKNPNSSIWKNELSTMNAVEGTLFSYNFATDLIDSTLTGVTFTTNKGVITNKTVSYTIPWGSPATDTIKVSALHNNKSSDLVLILKIANGDTSKPVIKRIFPSKADDTIGSSQVTVKFEITDTNAGVGNVTFKSGNKILTDTSHSENTYQCLIKDLVKGQKTEVRVVAVDASMKKNTDSSIIYLTYDSTVQDKEPPSIDIKSGPKSGSRVTSASGTEVITVTDVSGIQSVTALQNGQAITNIINSGSDYTIPYLFSAKGISKIDVIAVDNSPAHNTDTFSIYLNYNTTVSSVALSSPLDKQTGGDLSPALSWTGGDDLDGDTVFYRVVYGTKDTSSLSLTTEDVIVKSVKLNSLLSNQTYYWRVIAFSKQFPDTVKSAVFSFTTINSDTIGPVITLQDPVTDSAKVSYSSYDVKVKCVDGSGVKSVTCTIGSTNIPVTIGPNGVFTASLTNLAIGATTVVFTATDSASKANSTTKSITIVYDPTMKDTIGPVITLQDPFTDSAKVSASELSIKVKCTDASGVKSVACSFGGKSYSVLRETGDIFSAAVSSLVAGPNVFTFTAVDSSSNANNTTKKVTIIYDSTLSDNVKPSITLVNPVNSGVRVFVDTITVQVKCIDKSGIKSVTCTRSGKNVDVTNKDSLYSVKLISLTPGKSDTAYFTATDNSANANVSQPFAVIINYNTLIGSVTLTSPSNNLSDVELQPTFKWSGGVDPDGDAVTFKLRYGTSYSTWDTTISNVTTTSLTVTKSLKAYTKYYWQVVANSKVNSDSSKSVIDSFTTVGIAPSIITAPKDTTLDAGGTLKLTVKTSGTPSPTYKWYKDGVAIGVNSDSYTVSTVTKDDAGSYYVVVSNGISPDAKSASVTVTVITTYKVNFDDQSATIAVNPKTLKVISPATNVGTLPTQPKRDEYNFGGWWTQKNGGGTQFTATTTVSSDITVYAYWIEIPMSTVTFYDDGATTPVSPNVVQIPTNSYFTAEYQPTPPKKKGYTFSGWYAQLSGQGGKIDGNSKITANITLYAYWQIKDLDGNTYSEIKLGSQVWMGENFKCTKYNNGTAISKIRDSAAWANNSLPAYCSYEVGSTSAPSTYGLYYNSYVIETGKLAPEGWHIPTDEEYDALQSYLSNNGYDCGSDTRYIASSMASKTDWESYTKTCSPGGGKNLNNSSGLNIYPSGFRDGIGVYNGLGTHALLWSIGSDHGIVLYYPNTMVYGISTSDGMRTDALNYGYPVRLIKDQ